MVLLDLFFTSSGLFTQPRAWFGRSPTYRSTPNPLCHLMMERISRG
jgi:hypothetical protein